MNKQENCSCSKDRMILPVIQEGSSCCSPVNEAGYIIPGLKQSFVTDSILTVVGRIPKVSAGLQSRDHWGTIKARWGIGRMAYTVDPGLYALGNPDNDSPVLVTANYKMSFDKLRGELACRNLWILVLDTKGINVWCAAGHGTFGTEELIKRIASSGLKNIVSHRKLILPQLGAPGVAAHQVKRFSGFKVYYGPIRAKDLPAYLDSGWKATPAMRIMHFPLKERAVLIPIELIAAVKQFLIIAPVVFILSGIGGPAGFWANTINYGFFAVIALFAAVFSGAVLNPLLLPYLPGRAFSTKGFYIGIIVALVLLHLRDADLQIWAGKTETLAWLLMIAAISSFLAMNFTGASTYTSLSGVKKEMRWALPAQIAVASAGFLTWIASRLIA
ncbi:MAG: mercury methylation corrinoid protein HgcA [Smithella sp.]